MTNNEGPLACPALPAPLTHIARRIPAPFTASVVRRIAGPLLNRVFADALAGGELAVLESRELVLDVQDLGLSLGFRVAAGQLQIGIPTTADTRIRGPFAAFLRLAAREADADALFFHRMLVMEGDTELGLAIRNVVDAADLSGLPAGVRRMIEGMTRLIPAQPPGSASSMPASPYQ